VTCNGSTDDTTAINNAISDINGFGGGTLQFPTGTCLAEGIVVRSFVTLAGNGRLATVIQGRNTTTGAIIATLNFATLTGSNTQAGPFKWGLRDITIDGNKANRASGDAIDIYGYDFTFYNVDVRNAPGINIYSEFAVSSSCPGPGGDCMEAKLINVKTFNGGGNGVTWNGPHDSQFVNVLSFSNTGNGFNFGQTANYSARGVDLLNIHAYGNSSWGIVTNTYLVGSGVTSETNQSGGGIQVNTANQGLLFLSSVSVFSNVGPGIQLNTVSNVLTAVNSNGNTGSSGDGVQILANDNVVTAINSTGNAQSGVNIQGSANFVSGDTINNLSALNFVSSTGGNVVSVQNFQSSGNVFFSATNPQPSDIVDVGSTGVVLQFHQRPGTITNDSAQAGNVGELISATVAQGSAIVSVSGTAFNVTSISLTAGDWDVSANAYLIPQANTSLTAFTGSMSTTSATNNGTVGFFFQTFNAAFVPGANVQGGNAIGPARVSLSATTTYFLVIQANWTVAAPSGFGIIRARRMR
jgi:hypothetical protein